MLNYVSPVDTDLNKDQMEAYKIMLAGKSVFITGAGGTGKSYLIEKFYNRAVKIHGSFKVAKTSTTGKSALNINGRTIHSWAGIGLGTEDVDTLIKDMYPTTRSRWEYVKVIIIDEISMLHPDVLDKLYTIGKRLNKGTIQFILVGDPFQLPVIDKELKKESKKEFDDAKCWKSLIGSRVFRLDQVIRQSDQTFVKVLKRIRLGIHNKYIQDIIRSRIGVPLDNEYGIKPTVLYPKNKDVSKMNLNELNVLKRAGAKSKEFNATYKCIFNSSGNKTETLINEFRKNSNVEDLIELAVGAQVVFKKNMTYSDGIGGPGGPIIEVSVVNGTRGVVSRFEDGYPVVTLLSGTTIKVIPEKFTYSVKDSFEIIKTQVPLKLAWACSIHSSQGLTLDYVICDIGKNIFDYGQSYVVLSRVRTLEGLSIVSFDPDQILVNPKTLLKYYPEVVYLRSKECIFSDDVSNAIIDYLI
jgi:ATP-dependent DNA helicase PIF1